MIRIIGVLILSLSAVCACLYIGARAKKRTELLECCIGLIRSFSVDIGYCSEPVKVMLKKAADNTEFDSLCFLKEICESDLSDFITDWKKSIKNFSVNSFLNKSDISLLISFGERLGTTDILYQTQLCNEYIQRFEERYEKAKNKLPEYIRLCRIGGVVCGLAVLILLM